MKTTVLDQFKEYMKEFSIEVDNYQLVNGVLVLMLLGQGRVKFPQFARSIKAHTTGKEYRHLGDLHDMASVPSKLLSVVMEYLEEEKIADNSPGEKIKDDSLDEFTLCRSLEYSQSIRDIPMFLISPDGYISQMPASEYIIRKGIENPLEMAKGYLPVYDPMRPPGTWTMETADGAKIECVNSYIPPTWQRYKGDVPDELPETVKYLFQQIEGKLDRKYFYHWLYTMITGRNSSYLILQGVGGLGKGTIKSVMRALVGNHNFANGKKETITGAFNGALEGVKLSVFDEFKFDLKDENILKEIPNDTISIERKFQNSSKSTRIFVSMVIMNNEKRDNYLSFDGRKFAPLMLSNKRLEAVVPGGKNAINDLLAKIEDPTVDTFDVAYIAQIGRWILKHGNHGDLFPQGEYRGPKFWELCHTSMPAWKRAIVIALSPTSPLTPKDKNELDALVEKGELLYSKLENLIKKQQKNTNQKVNWPGDFSGPRSFLDMFRDLQGNPVYETLDANDPVLGDFYIKKILADEDLL